MRPCVNHTVTFDFHDWSSRYRRPIGTQMRRNNGRPLTRLLAIEVSPGSSKYWKWYEQRKILVTTSHAIACERLVTNWLFPCVYESERGRKRSDFVVKSGVVIRRWEIMIIMPISWIHLRCCLSWQDWLWRHCPPPSMRMIRGSRNDFPPASWACFV